MLCLVPVFATESLQSAINLDIWLVADLVQDLSKENFTDREQATRRLIALGPAVISEINEHLGTEHMDAETRERLSRVLRDVELAHLGTFTHACREYERLSEEIASLNPESHGALIAKKRERADRILARMEAMPVEGDRGLQLAEMLESTGSTLFRSPGCAAQAAILRYAITDLQSAILLYEQALVKTPGNPALSASLNRTAALLGSARWLDNPRFE
jgi:hypothetical protein